MSETSSVAGDSHSRSSRLSAELERLALASGHNPLTHRKGDSFSDKNSIDSEELRSEYWLSGDGKEDHYHGMNGR